jgi:hypothetical protein
VQLPLLCLRCYQHDPPVSPELLGTLAHRVRQPTLPHLCMGRQAPTQHAEGCECRAVTKQGCIW